MKHCALIVFILLEWLLAPAQVLVQMDLLPDNQTYRVSVVPQQTYTAPFDITNSAQISFRTATGTYELADFEGIHGIWVPSSVFVAPPESPDYDYFSFVLGAPLAAGQTSYQLGEPKVLFTFTNANVDCTGGGVEIIDENDPFYPPNGQMANVGNLFTILGFGPGNAYLGTVPGASGAPCPDPLALLVPGDTSVNCFGELLNLEFSITGGLGPYSLTYSLPNTIGTVTLDVAAAEVPTLLADLPPGTYDFVVTDSLLRADTVALFIAEPDPLVVELTSEPASCTQSLDGSVAVTTVSGGNAGAYAYAWSTTDATTPVISAGPGVHVLTLTDVRGCVATAQREVTAENDFSLASELSQVTCAGLDDGSIALTPLNGNAPYTYEWSGGVPQPGLSIQSNLPIGTYAVTVVDATGICAVTDTLVITEPSGIRPVVEARTARCTADTVGVLSVLNVTNGQGPFLYALDGAPLEQTSDFMLPTGRSYTLVVEDSRGCLGDTTVWLPTPLPLEVQLRTDARTVALGEPVQLDALTNYPAAALDFAWQTLDSLNCSDCPDPELLPLRDQLVGVAVTDTFGCVATAELRLTVEKPRTVFLPSAFSPNGDGENDVYQIGLGPNVARLVDLRVFDRWGALVYQTDEYIGNSNRGWNGRGPDGRAAPVGSYVVTGQLVFIDGHREPFGGAVTLLR